VVYGIAARMAKDYCGSYWQMYTLWNGGFYMAPDGHSIYQVCCDNYFTGELSAEGVQFHSSRGGSDPWCD
jgi:hypothetical protein